MRLLLLVTIAIFASVTAIFEDQAGKFDWRKQLVGCPAKITFDKVGSKSDRLIVSTAQSVLASLVLNTGNIGWRQIMENPSGSTNGLTFTKDREYIYSISEDGRSVRVWNKNNGVLAHQLPISEQKSEIQAIHVTNQRLHVASGRTLVVFRLGDEKPVETVISKTELTFSAFFQQDDVVIHVSALKNAGKSIELSKITEDGAFEPLKTVEIKDFEPKNCHVQEAYLSCSTGSTLQIVDIFRQKVQKIQLETEILEISGHGPLILARGAKNAQIVEITAENGAQVRKSVDIGAGEALGITENHESVIVTSSDAVRVVFVNSATHFSAKRVKMAENLENSAPKSIFGRKNDKDWEIVIVGEDCHVEFVTVDQNSKSVNLEWSREESLITAVSVEMVDLPLSESQQMIEDEFEDGESNIISAFIRRIQVQFGQLCRQITRSIEKVIYVVTSITKNGNGVADFINSVRSASGSGSAASGPFERDYFNLRKVIIVATSTGTVFGIDSADGRYLWKLWLGEHFQPLESPFDGEKVPLFVQRTTAHYQLDGLASVVFSNKLTHNGVIVSFNPMVGKVVSRNELGYPVKRLSLLPVHTHKHVYPVMLIGKNEEIKIFPSITPEELSATTPYLYLLDIQSQTVQGLKIDISSQKITPVWQGNLGLTAQDDIIAVKGKSFNQKVHSQGRVLVTREVQYKYVNPNLAAIASINRADQHMTITLVDIVTGQIVHSASIGKAAKPIHMVHSENWIAYSYWSDKGRRTELGIIELYEGTEEQHTQKEVFDSKIAEKLPPVVAQQSYIYAQGVDAMSVSETEQGLTTRSILVAHPSGNIHEVSRRLLDANRPMELTQAMREEMMIGYMPEIAVATEEMINYNQTVHRVRGIKTSPSGLESTSLVLAYGTDLFFTRLVPSGTFDILKDDFDHVLISLVLTGLVVGSYVSKRLARSNALASQWS
ncbi:ER membrane protein complex subunit 1 [Caenorhabditis elegans]|uniref:ER membrane protein complex subunit 1 n=1 Tax=Caenorhabditis elegans TaxID=6239 RepID=H2L0C0_CAEEL|nr:ER membrane protein complex subunit 1 [Caenorhabditis elegans]CCD72387.1 ER membrane protein complex subunit 1 [Caenorhabditis elegans]|eukprot:NP_493980.1 EMC Endoplasmic Membrane protein Complex (yeast EMC) homolog [Caenorhabditis elegans]